MSFVFNHVAFNSSTIKNVSNRTTIEGTIGKHIQMKRLLVVNCNEAACDVASGKELQNEQETQNIC